MLSLFTNKRYLEMKLDQLAIGKKYKKKSSNSRSPEYQSTRVPTTSRYDRNTKRHLQMAMS